MKTQDHIKKMRASGWTQQQIADAVGMPQPRVFRWERRGAPKHVDDALTLAAISHRKPPKKNAR
ncbi:MAG: helix-turn-helix transcriptional regulator [Propionivibrio sp.]|nr:helix-turn-helix transcriptional regulator [Propionivibrio sp.]